MTMPLIRNVSVSPTSWTTYKTTRPARLIRPTRGSNLLKGLMTGSVIRISAWQNRIVEIGADRLQQQAQHDHHQEQLDDGLDQKRKSSSR